MKPLSWTMHCSHTHVFLSASGKLLVVSGTATTVLPALCTWQGSC